MASVDTKREHCRAWLTVFVLALMACSPAIAAAQKPRIVNIYNFVRNSDYRVADSENVLFETTRSELELVHQYKLPATFALQYDALINPRYQKLFKETARPEDEIAGWWEIPRPLAEKAGLKWRGAHDWDSTANIGFSPGYTPDERRKLVDVYMADFKAVFGAYPLTVGSWYIDEVTLAYMADRYGVVASCNCKDQIGTDGYTLWGGYWNQAYYPSRLNAYMPAQTREGQLNIPIFRMLGSDPIYQFGAPRGIYSLEPVYRQAGGSAAWVDWFTDQLIHQPCLAFAYTQAGQENSFGWKAIEPGLTMQMEKFDRQSRAGEITVQTLADSGKWFRSSYPETPATAVVCMSDWRHEDRKTVWYDSRFYRVNFLWNKDGLMIRDLHLFDERIVSPTHDSVLQARSLAYNTLPIIDSALWSDKQNRAGGFPMLIDQSGKWMVMPVAGAPVISEASLTELKIVQPIQDGGTLTIICGPTKIAAIAMDRNAQPLQWCWTLVGGPKQKSAVQGVSSHLIQWQEGNNDYELPLAPEDAHFGQADGGEIRAVSGKDGRIELQLGVDLPT